MRDIALTAVVFGSIPLIFMRPWIGVLVWTWLAYMNPQRLTYGFAYDFQFSLLIGLVVIVAYLLRGEKRPPVNALTILMLVFTIWVTITLIPALLPDAAFLKWTRFMKQQLLIFILLCVINDRFRLNVFVWVSALSIGFYGIKGGFFTIVNGGNFRVWGPMGSMIEENNALAVVLIAIIPLFRALQLNLTNKWLRLAMLGCMGLIFASVLGSQSRGALLAIAAMGGFFWWKSRKKVVLGIFGVIAVIGMLSIMPQSWYDRMDTIGNYEQDASATGRIDAWIFAINLANDRPIFGGGFNVFGNQRLFDIYNPEAPVPRAAHSAYFEILGDQGYIGLLLYMIIAMAAWMTLRRTLQLTRDRPDLRPERDLAAMLQVSLIGFWAGSAFLNLATFDFYWGLLATAAILYDVVRREVSSPAPSATAPEPAPPGGPLGRRLQAAGTPPAPATGGVSGFLVKGTR
jgi:probable O-glycosylation ligase (exosortase A-associated)